ncbi:MAG: class I SAM-dependent methyltransferase [Acidobacteriia bacterium]|nr:class I SAM-dependent methyltransferase [Terriglobia bacterium]
MREGEAFLDALDRRAKILAPAARATYEANRNLCSWLLDPLARWSEAAYGNRAFDDAARGYAKYCMAVGKAQEVYERARRYTTEDMPQIMSGVYEDDGYMVPYMWAAVLIYAFWPSMINHIAIFRDEFLKCLPRESRILELACGHGVLSLLAAEERPDVQVQGVDISPPAIAIANRLLDVSGHSARITYAVKDALQSEAIAGQTGYDGIISAMLAEHLPDPRPLFTAVSRQLSKDGYVFFSTAIESAQRDHVFEMNHESQPIQMAEAARLRVTRLVSDAGTVPPGCHFLPRATAMIFRPR